MMKKTNLFNLVLILSLIMCVLMISCKSTPRVSENSLPIEGRWLLVVENGEKVTHKIHIKTYLDNHFSWYWANNSGVITSGAYGRYVLDGKRVTEYLDMTTPTNTSYLKTTATLDMKFENDTLYAEGMMNSDGLKYTEKWVRIK